MPAQSAPTTTPSPEAPRPEICADLLWTLRRIERRADFAPHDDPVAANREFRLIRDLARAAIRAAGEVV